MSAIEIRIVLTLDERTFALLERFGPTAAAPAESSAPARAEPGQAPVCAAPPASPSAGHRPRLRWTEDSKRILRTAWPEGVPTREIADRLREVGIDATPARIVSRAASLGLKRPPWSVPPGIQAALGAKQAARRAAAERPSPAAPLAPAPAEIVPAAERRGVPVETLADFETIRRWGAERGTDCRTLGDIAAVNQKRSTLGLPPFAHAPRAAGGVR